MAKKRRNKKLKKNLRRKRVVALFIFVMIVFDLWVYYPYFINTTPDLKEYCYRLKSPAGSQPTSEAPTVHNSVEDACAVDFSSLELPYFEEEDFIFFKKSGRYVLNYDTMYRQAVWVAYLLTKEDVMTNNAKRKDKFIPDPDVADMGYPVAYTKHYTNSGYDRGHLCPSADRNNNQDENDCTFHLSNISPQTPALNRGVWKNLEDKVRDWAVSYDSLYIVTGGVLESGLPTIAGGIGVPNYFYKTILTRHEGEFHAIAFIIPNNEKFNCGYREYAVCVDSLQNMTSINFFHNLPSEIETVVESEFSDAFWFLNN